MSTDEALAKKLKDGLEALEIKVAPEAQVSCLNFLDFLLQKNKRLNLTAIRNKEEAIEKHLIDSLVLLPIMESLPPSTDPSLYPRSSGAANRGALMDVGSGGGFPGIPLKCVRTDIKVSLIEAKAKKVKFLKEAIHKVGLKNIKAYHHFLNPDCPVDFLGRYDWIVSRATMPIEDFIRTTLLYKKESGGIIIMKGPKADDEIEACIPQIQRLGLTVDRRVHFKLPFSKADRIIVVLK
jgi:16S rRNA (guanine527-N7)-methyltransferase